MGDSGEDVEECTFHLEHDAGRCYAGIVAVYALFSCEK
jgi:hypothetical protein